MKLLVASLTFLLLTLDGNVFALTNENQVSSDKKSDKDNTRVSRPVFNSELDAVLTLSPLSNIRKDTYESTTDFKARLCGKTHELLEIKPGATFEVPLFETHGTYNADKKEISFTSYNTRPFYNQAIYNKYIGLQVASKTEQGASYVGTNAFGVKKDITKESQFHVELLLPIKAPTKSNGLFVKIPFSPLDAKKIIDDLRLVVSTSLSNSCAVTSWYHSSPTIDSPYDIDRTSFGIVGASDARWKIINKRSGEVLKSGNF